MSEKTLLDPLNYDSLNAGFPTIEDADVAINEFWKEFYELRNKYKLPDVHVIVRIVVAEKDGKGGDAMVTMHAGSEMHAEAMCAYAYGRAGAERQERLMKILQEAKPAIRIKEGRNRK